MLATASSPAPRATLARCLATVLVALASLTLLLAVPPARGDDPLVPIASGTGLDWGIKESFRSYIEGGIASGTIAVSDGATRNGDGTFHFPLREGIFDPATNATVVQFDGTVHMEGHAGALELSVSDPRVELTPTQARLLVDLTSRPLGGGDPVLHPGAQIASLALSGVDPVVDATTTTWSAIPALLSPPAVAAFAGHYSVGTDLDPVFFAYDGPGGKPLPPLEQWSTPGVPVFDTVGHAELPGVSIAAVAPDPASGVLHAVGRLRDTGGTAYRALDLSSLALEASLDDPEPSWDGAGDMLTTQRVALADGTLYVLSLAGPTHRTRLADGAYTQDAPIGTAAPSASSVPSHIAAAPGAARLYVTGGLSSAPWARTLTPSGGDWVEQVHTLDGSRGISTDLAVDPDGTVIETHVLGRPATRAVTTLNFDVSPVTRTDVAGTLVTGANGLARLALAPGGVLYASEAEAPTARILKLVKGPGGYAVAGSLLQTNARVRQVAADPDDGTLYAGTWEQGDGQADGRLLAIRDGAIVGEVALPEPVNQVAVAGGTAYASDDDDDVWAIRQLGVTPAVTDQPDDAAVVLASAEPSREVTFSAAATGSPAPSVRWQARAPGDATFEDLPGETAPQLTLEATVADDGTQYRAVFTNATGGATPRPVGELASAPATLSVQALPSLLVQPADVAAIEGAPALLKVLPAGNPAPAVQWQWRAAGGGSWSNVPGATDAFLALPATTLAMDGRQYRVVLSSALGTSVSQPATLTVAPALPASVTFGSGHVDWGVKASFRSYVVGPIAHGSYTASDGATKNSDGTIRFELLGGSYQSAARTGELQLHGTVRFSGHDGQLDLTLRNPRLVLDGDLGTLRADAVSRRLADGALVGYPDVALASVDLAGISPTPTLDGLAFTALSAALAPAAVPVFELYTTGTVLDPLSVSAAYGVPRDLPQDPPPASPPPGGERPPAGGERPAPPRAGVARAAAGELDGRGATVAIVSCRRGPCRVSAPRRVHVRIGRRTFRATVLPPATLAGGERGRVRVQLTRRASARLGCRRATIALRFTIEAAGTRAPQSLVVTVRRPAGCRTERAAGDRGAQRAQSSATTASISTLTPFGSSATPIVTRAGGSPGKNAA